MQCVKSKQSVEEIIKKSRFIGIAIPSTTEQGALKNLQQLYTEHPNANHIAFAYRIQTPTGLICRYYDAGEPTGTAGKPIFQHLEGKNLINLLIVVIRYFGGVKLGVGGLTRAYGNTAKKVIEASDITDYVILAKVKLKLTYNRLQPLEYFLKKLDGRIIQQDFSEHIDVLIELPAHHERTLLQEFSQPF